MVVKKAAAAQELEFADTSNENKDLNVEYDFGANKVSFVKGKAKALVLKLDVDISNLFKGKVISKDNLVGSLVLEEDGKASKELEFGKDYTAKEGSIIINLSGNCLNGLKVGSYKLKLKTKVGFASINLVVLNPAPVPGSQPQIQPTKPVNQAANSPHVANKPGAKGALTGDTTGLVNYIIIGSIALAILIIGLIARRKATQNKK